MTFSCCWWPRWTNSPRFASIERIQTGKSFDIPHHFPLTSSRSRWLLSPAISPGEGTCIPPDQHSAYQAVVRRILVAGLDGASGVWGVANGARQVYSSLTDPPQCGTLLLKQLGFWNPHKLPENRKGRPDLEGTVKSQKGEAKAQALW